MERSVTLRRRAPTLQQQQPPLLLLLLLLTAAALSSGCDVRNDLRGAARKTQHAPVVFAGRVRSRGAERHGVYQVTVDVESVVKGDAAVGSALRLRFRRPAEDGADVAGRRRPACVAEAIVETGERYIVFVKPVGGPRNFTAVAAPERHSSRNMRKVTRASRRKRRGLVPALCRQLEHADSTVRQKAAHCLGVIAGHAIGRQDLLKHDALTHLSWRFTDEVPLVRRNVHQAVGLLLRTKEGVMAGHHAGLIPQLLDRVVCELPEIVLLCLLSLQPLLREDPRRGLLLGAVRTMNKLLRSELSSIRAAAAGCVHNLCRPTQGKNEATVLGSIPLLVILLKDWDPSVRTQAAAALASVLVTTPAKQLAVTLPAVEHLLVLAKDFQVPAAQMLALQALAVLTAHPEAREELLEHTGVFEEAARSENEGVSACARSALEDVLWEP